jgi:hypothetical protein
MLCGNPILWPLAIRLTAMAARVVSPKSSHGVTPDRAGGQVFRNGIPLRRSAARMLRSPTASAGRSLYETLVAFAITDATAATLRHHPRGTVWR